MEQPIPVLAQHILDWVVLTQLQVPHIRLLVLATVPVTVLAMLVVTLEHMVDRWLTAVTIPDTQVQLLDTVLLTVVVLVVHTTDTMHTKDIHHADTKVRLVLDTTEGAIACR